MRDVSFSPSRPSSSCRSLFYFFVDVRDHQNVYVGWRAGHFLFVAFAVLVGYALQELWRRAGEPARRPWPRRLSWRCLSLPTFAIDFYNTQDITNQNPADNFSWTLVLIARRARGVHLDPRRDASRCRRADRAACRVKDAGGPTCRRLPSAAWRRVCRSRWCRWPSTKRRATRCWRSIRSAIRTPLSARAARLGIDYLIVGPPERKMFPDFESDAALAAESLSRGVSQRRRLDLHARGRRVSRIAVVTSSPPLVEGGHMVIARSLAQALREAGHEADIVVTPQNRFGRQASAYVATWLTDVGQSAGHRIDQVISLRYPSYAVRHPRHVCWLNHTMREYYDLWERFSSGLSPQNRFKESVRRRALHAADRYLLTRNVSRLFVQSRTIQARLQMWPELSRRCSIRRRRSVRIGVRDTATTSSWCRG